MSFERVSDKCRIFIGAVGIIGIVGVTGFHAHAVADEKMMAKFVGKNWVNGRSWEKLDYSGKLGFVCGIFDGITLFWSSADTGQMAKRDALNTVYNSLSVPSSLTVGDVVNGMDEFYRDAANLDLPAICAYIHFVYRSRGEATDSVDRRLNTWRKMFGQP